LPTIGVPHWAPTHAPGKKIICASYGQELANKLALDSRTLMMSPMNTRLNLPLKSSSAIYRYLQTGESKESYLE